MLWTVKKKTIKIYWKKKYKKLRSMYGNKRKEAQ